MSLKQKTFSGILWSNAENFINQGITFIVGIILARLLTPEEFGLIGMITIFIAVSESVMKSGFGEALIRKKDCTQEDYSTVFYYNLLVGILLSLLLFSSASVISKFFDKPELKSILRVLLLVLIIDAFSVIQFTILIKRVDFRLLTRISFISSISSGLFAIILAFKGWGVWSLVMLQISRRAINSIFLWAFNRWRPSLMFSKASFVELFGFGSKLFASGLIDTIYNNVYYVVIGKYFSASDLGFFTRAQTFARFPSQNISHITNRVFYPILAQMQDNLTLLKQGYRRIIRSLMLITFILMMGLAAVAEPLIITLIGEQWRPSIIYLQMLCFALMLYPLHAINLNIIKVLGRSDLFLKLEIIKKTLAIPLIILGIFLGIKIMIAGMILLSFVSYYLNSYYSGKLIGYSTVDQLRDITPSFLLSTIMAIVVYFIGVALKIPYSAILFIQLLIGAIVVFGFCELTNMKDYLYLKKIIIDRIHKR